MLVDCPDGRVLCAFVPSVMAECANDSEAAPAAGAEATNLLGFVMSSCMCDRRGLAVSTATEVGSIGMFFAFHVND